MSFSAHFASVLHCSTSSVRVKAASIFSSFCSFTSFEVQSACLLPRQNDLFLYLVHWGFFYCFLSLILRSLSMSIYLSLLYFQVFAELVLQVYCVSVREHTIQASILLDRHWEVQVQPFLLLVPRPYSFLDVGLDSQASWVVVYILNVISLFSWL